MLAGSTGRGGPMRYMPALPITQEPLTLSNLTPHTAGSRFRMGRPKAQARPVGHFVVIRTRGCVTEACEASPLPMSRTKLTILVVGTFLACLLVPALLLLGPYLLILVVIIGLPPGMLVGELAAFDRTRPVAIWVFRAFTFLLGWFCGLNAAVPLAEGDKAFALEFARFLAFLWLLLPPLPFVGVGIVLFGLPSVRRFGRDLLLSLHTTPSRGSSGVARE